MDNIIKGFKEYLCQTGYGKSSQYQLPFCAQEFLITVGKPIENITKGDILSFHNYLKTRPLKNGKGVLGGSMINTYMYALRTFFSWAVRTGAATENPMGGAGFKRAHVGTRQPLSVGEVQKLFKCAENSKGTAMLHLFYSCGLRRAEAEDLDLADVHLAQCVLYVRDGKGGKQRAIPFNESVKNAFENYLSNGRPQGGTAFLLDNKGRRMKRGNIYRAFKAVVARAGLPPSVGPHHLRHSIATHLLENGLRTALVKDFLGHSSMKATRIYAKVKPNQTKHL